MAAKVIGPSGVTGPSGVIDPTREPTIIFKMNMVWNYFLSTCDYNQINADLSLSEETAENKWL